MSKMKLSRNLVLPILVCMITGCSNSDRPPLGSVTGTVTLDGKPLEYAVVKFDWQLAEGGRMSNGVADENGYYKMVYRDYHVTPPSFVACIDRGNALRRHLR
ncbi:MAG: hypothetical protein KDB01_18805 [Planctomycetaceae bacterium]|nr:hypothetical protein [Planctomycetaceae bacterium]